MFDVIVFIIGMGVGAAVLGAAALAWPEPATFASDE